MCLRRTVCVSPDSPRAAPATPSLLTQTRPVPQVRNVQTNAGGRSLSTKMYNLVIDEMSASSSLEKYSDIT